MNEYKNSEGDRLVYAMHMASQLCSPGGKFHPFSDHNINEFFSEINHESVKLIGAGIRTKSYSEVGKTLAKTLFDHYWELAFSEAEDLIDAERDLFDRGPDMSLFVQGVDNDFE